MSLQYIFVSEVYELCIVGGRSWEQHSVCGNVPSIQQSSHASSVYTLLHNFTFTLLSTSMPSHQPLVQ